MTLYNLLDDDDVKDDLMVRGSGHSHERDKRDDGGPVWLFIHQSNEKRFKLAATSWEYERVSLSLSVDNVSLSTHTVKSFRRMLSFHRLICRLATFWRNKRKQQPQKNSWNCSIRNQFLIRQKKQNKIASETSLTRQTKSDKFTEKWIKRRISIFFQKTKTNKKKLEKIPISFRRWNTVQRCTEWLTR